MASVDATAELVARLVGMGFRHAWAIDFEFRDTDGNVPTVVCMAAKCLITGAVKQLWENELRDCPFEVDDRTLFIAYFASAEMGCFRALSWPRPKAVICLFAEYRRHTNDGTELAEDNSLDIDLDVNDGTGRRRNKRPQKQNRLIDALMHFGLSTVGGEEKRAMIDRILQGPPWSVQEIANISDYCMGDVDAVQRLATVLLTRLNYPDNDDLFRALYRGRYMIAVADMEHTGIPIDMHLRARLIEHWDDITLRLIGAIDPLYEVYDGDTFVEAKFDAYLARSGLSWPRYPTGRPILRDVVFKSMSDTYPQLSPLRELRHAMGQLRLKDLKVGRDGRNRALLSPFASLTGRNQPSSSGFAFGQSVWLRGLIKPPKGFALAYLDWSGQEIGVAAAMSADQKLWEAYDSGEPYIHFAALVDMVPKDATGASHPNERRICKSLFLGVNYGMEAGGISVRANILTAEARRLLRRHRETFHVFWRWTEGNIIRARLGKTLRTVFDWLGHYTLRPGRRCNPRSVMNFSAQANGAEIMRLAACLAVEDGLAVCCPVHDAFLLQAPARLIEVHARRLVEIMGDASEIVLGKGHRLRCGSDFNIVHYPGRYRDSSGRGTIMFRRVMRLLNEIENEKAASATGRVGRGHNLPVGGVAFPRMGRSMDPY